MSKLSTIGDYYAHLNNQMAVYNHLDNTYIIPYYSKNSNDTFKIAIVDVYNDKIIKTISQPWSGRMNLQQIYDKPIAPLIFKKDTLFVPKGKHYKWFLNNIFIGETNTNYWIPTQKGKYRAEVEFREYTASSTEKEIILTKTDDSEFDCKIKIYPNPAYDFIKIDFPLSQYTRIRIVDLTGSVIRDVININTSSIELNINDLISGVYRLSLDTESLKFCK